MEKRWVNRKIDLALLTTHIGNLFKEKDFEAIKGEIPTGHQILAEGSPRFRFDGYASVTIEGKPDDFSVKLEHCEAERKGSLAPILMTTMFFGGYFLSRKLRSAEEWTELEKEFWNYVDNAVLRLGNSVRDSPCPPSGQDRLT
jgi:hypothetical protein